MCVKYGAFFNAFTNRFKKIPSLTINDIDIYKQLPCERLHIKFCKFLLGD